jgi:hypothetical protein
MESVHQAARDSGMNDDQGNAMVGGILSFLKDHISNDNYQRIVQHFPGADDAVQTHSRAMNSGFAGWIGNAVSTLDSKFNNGTTMNSNNNNNNNNNQNNPTAASSSSSSSSLTEFGALAGLVTYLASKGISPSMVKKFLNFLVPLLQKKCGVDISPYLGKMGAGGGGGGAAAAAAAVSSSINSTSGPSSTGTKDTDQTQTSSDGTTKFLNGIKSWFD